MAVGSLLNHLAGQSIQSYAETPAIGDGVTVVGWSDRRAATVVHIFGPDTFEAQYDAVDYAFPSGRATSIKPDPKGGTFTVRRRHRGKGSGQWRSEGQVVMVGVRDPYFDHSF